MATDNALYYDAEHIISKLLDELKLNLNKPVYTRNEAMELLGVDSKTLKRYQDEGLIGYSQPIPGGKIFFSRQDIDDFLANSHCEAFYYKGL
ncbi:MAG: helix-turn-helix domain-containing protein [Bacteroidetes bacterium]|uniref:Helix-turn-helix domain-containing protein n=1 Tax=Candidatus Cryptobacteroides avicola TaxID=2840757 RepID=A0A940IIF2_9BACT|nr:helix-turn-helix domain-containing protein [Candidatus Cryptobacteroides avicola]